MATTTMNISLPEPMRDWVISQTESGQYSNNSDYVRDLIRRDQQRVEKIKTLQSAIDKGLVSGIAEGFSMEQLQRELDRD